MSEGERSLQFIIKKLFTKRYNGYKKLVMYGVMRPAHGDIGNMLKKHVDMHLIHGATRLVHETTTPQN
jgi:hypothetical protein